jgi:GNAT superfamily N-acetyltransferase
MKMAQVTNGRIEDRTTSVNVQGDGWFVWTDAGHLYFRRLDFDCEALGLEAAQVAVWQTPQRQCTGFIRQAMALAADRFEHVTWKLPVGQRSTYEAATEVGFRPIVVNQAFAGPLVGSSDHEARIVRRAEPGDKETLCRLCAAVFCKDTRYHRDPCLPQDRVPGLYRRWMENSLAGYADLVLVAGQVDVSGFLTARFDGDTVYVDLLGVEGESRRMGVGKALFGALREASVPGVIRVTADTEEGNLDAVSFYTSQGLAPGARTNILQIGLEEWG